MRIKLVHAEKSEQGVSMRKVNKLILGLLACCMILPLVLSASEKYGADNIDRLFTSPQQRQKLDTMRTAPSNTSEEKPAVTNVELNGVMIREDGNNVIWVNDKSSLKSNKVDGVRVNPKAVNKETYKVPVKADEHRMMMKPGQSWSETTGTVKDNY